MTYRNIVFFFSLTLIGLSCREHQKGQDGLVYWSSSNPEEIKFAKKYIDQWNTNNPGEPITFQPVPEGQSSEEVILAAVVGKTTPDIYSNMWQGDVEDFARAGVLIALDTMDGFMDFLYQRCDSLVVQEITSTNGHIYQIPWKVNPIIMMYNPTMFHDAGIKDVPKNYSSYLEAGGKIEAHAEHAELGIHWLGISEVSPIWWQRFFNFLPLYYAASHGAPLVKNDKAVFNNEYGVGVFTFLQELYTRGYFPREQLKGQSDPFLASRVSSTFTGPWTIEQNEKFKPEGFQYEFDFVPVPDTMTGPVFSYGDPKNIVIFNTCSDPEKAWSFLRTLLSTEADIDFLQLSGQFPRRKDINTNPLFLDYLKYYPKLIPFAEQTKYLRGMDCEPYMKEVLDIISQEYEACVVYGRKSPKDAIDDAAKAVDLLYIH
ncbi:MAG: extracellular solute-binding protein [Saprospiraceae bacterium]|uniref:Extracellular solute-binding protein n=1 Tax=Candidatus Opimibacter skivensis TaxID=2982028 RepID=A0A9D7SWP6_9BACT|nr:extracellular solute-binding protein [Candidatus Opimibacter skivensis]